MMEYTSVEKMAIIFFLNKIMEADSIIDPRELEFLDGIYEKLGVTEIDLPRMEMMDLEYSRKVISELTPDKLAFAKDSFKGMAMSDEFYDPKEKVLIESL